MLTQQLIILPRPAIERIKAMKGLHIQARKGMYLFCGELLRLSHYGKGVIGTPVDMQAVKIKNDFFGCSNKYRYYLEEMQKAGIIEINDFYQVGEQCKSYSLASGVLSEQFDAMILGHKMATPPKWLRIDCLATGKRLGQLVLNSAKAKAVTLEVANNERHLLGHRVQIGDEIKNSFFPFIYVWSNKRKAFTQLENVPKSHLFAKWDNSDFELIKNNDTFYFMPLKTFKEMKRLSILWHYTHVIANWQEHRFYAYRDARTFRKHSTISNTPKPLLPCLTYKGQKLTDIDLGCSQFALFARCLDLNKKPLLAAGIDRPTINKVTIYALENSAKLSSEAVNEFRRLVANGTLYDEIQKTLCLPSRDAAKVAAMAAFYSNQTGENNDTEQKAMVRTMFPEIVEFMDGFKDNQIAQGLTASELPSEMQRVESFLFVDEIAPELEALKIFHFTKHDSILVEHEQANKAYQVAQKILNERIGKGCYYLKTSKPSFTP